MTLTWTWSDGLPQDQDGLKDLPLVEVPAERAGPWLAVIVTGDGGWAALDKAVARTLSERGIGVVGLNALRYFWHEKPAREAARDLGRIVETYSQRWQRHRIVVIGYSFGADVLPFMVNRLPASVRSGIELVALFGPGLTAEFEIHILEWLGRAPPGAPVLPEVEALSWTHVLCVRGQQEPHSLCAALPVKAAHQVELPDGHHFGGDYEALTGALLAELQTLE